MDCDDTVNIPCFKEGIKKVVTHSKYTPNYTKSRVFTNTEFKRRRAVLRKEWLEMSNRRDTQRLLNHERFRHYNKLDDTSIIACENFENRECPVEVSRPSFQFPNVPNSRTLDLQHDYVSKHHSDDEGDLGEDAHIFDPLGDHYDNDIPIHDWLEFEEARASYHTAPFPTVYSNEEVDVFVGIAEMFNELRDTQLIDNEHLGPHTKMYLSVRKKKKRRVNSRVISVENVLEDLVDNANVTR